LVAGKLGERKTIVKSISKFSGWLCQRGGASMFDYQMADRKQKALNPDETVFNLEEISSFTD